MSDGDTRWLRLAHLYPTLMNLYGDRGNIACLRSRCEARGIGLEVEEVGLGDEFDAHAFDLVFMGGGQDREQTRVSEDLRSLKGPTLRSGVAAGMPVLTVCGGYQMMGHYYQGADGTRLPGLGIFDLATKHPGESVARCIGNIEVGWDEGELVGFENHGGRTYLGERATPLGRVRAGFGNNGTDGTEGCRYLNAFGTYLHGSLLPKNPVFADYLVGLALARKYGTVELKPLDDSFEAAAHAAAAAIARRDARSSRVTGRILRTIRVLASKRRIPEN